MKSLDTWKTPMGKGRPHYVGHKALLDSLQPTFHNPSPIILEFRPFPELAILVLFLSRLMFVSDGNKVRFLWGLTHVFLWCIFQELPILTTFIFQYLQYVNCLYLSITQIMCFWRAGTLSSVFGYSLESILKSLNMYTKMCWFNIRIEWE